MSRAVAAAAVLGAAAAAALVFALAEGLGGPAAVGAPPARPLEIATSIAPRPVFFGDLVTARAEVVVDRRRIDPARVRILPDFTPYALAEPARSSLVGSGRVTSLAYGFTLSCLSEACVPGARARTVVLPVLRVSAPLRGGGTAVAVAPWPAVEVSPRLAEAEVSASPPPWRLQLALPPVSYRADPGTLSGAFTAVAALLAAGALVLAGWELLLRRRTLRMRARALTRLAHALELVRQSASRAPDDRRKALAELARTLERDGDGRARLAVAAAQLAWARIDPTPAGVGALADEVERAVTAR